MMQISNRGMRIFFKGNMPFMIILAMYCTFFCGCSREIPINERPMYGGISPTPAAQKANEELIKEVEKQGSREHGARKAIDLGWSYCKKGDLATAMKRFNQAWLLNPNNSEIYCGFAYIAAKKIILMKQ